MKRNSFVRILFITVKNELKNEEKAKKKINVKQLTLIVQIHSVSQPMRPGFVEKRKKRKWKIKFRFCFEGKKRSKVKKRNQAKKQKISTF